MRVYVHSTPTTVDFVHDYRQPHKVYIADKQGWHLIKKETNVNGAGEAPFPDEILFKDPDCPRLGEPGSIIPGYVWVRGEKLLENNNECLFLLKEEG